MSVPCFTRAERNGMYVIQALAGRMKLDCLIVNETVKFVYDQIVQRVPLEEVTARYLERARAGRPTNGDAQRQTVGDPHTEDERLRFDLYRSLMAFRDRDIGDFAFEDIVTLLPSGRALRGTTQVMPICLLDATAAFVASALASAAPATDTGADETGPAAGVANAEVFYSFPAADRLNPGYFDAEQIVRRHLDQIEVYFVGVDGAGEVEAVTAVQGLPQQPATLRVFFVAARPDTPEGFEERMGIHIARLCGLLQVTTLSAKIRFQWTTGEDPRATRHPAMDRVLAELGFRRALVLSDEFGDGNALIAYDRVLF